jgi:hypothetical protein
LIGRPPQATPAEEFYTQCSAEIREVRMKRLTIPCSLLVVLVGAACATAGSPIPLDRPTPPPCAADGICYPNVNEWGYYPGRWRRWPGHELVPTPAKPSPEDRLGPDIAPYELPTPEKEDERAPPATTKREQTAPAAESGDEAPPSIDELDSPSGLEYPAPLSPFDESTTDLDPPPAPPFAARSGMQSTTAARLAPPAERQSDAPRTGSAIDPPPTVPWAYSASL